MELHPEEALGFLRNFSSIEDFFSGAEGDSFYFQNS